MDGENGFTSPSDDQEHFPSFEDRARSSTRHVTRTGRAVSPAHSAHGLVFRESLIQKQVKKAKKVQFYRNGDRFYKGLTYAVSVERFRTFESLLAELTNSPICDKNIMPNGVRAIFSIDGSRKISSIEEMEEDGSYVCASTQVFKKVNYPKMQIPNWSFNMNSTDWDTSVHQVEECEENLDFIRPKLVTVIRNGSRPRKAVRVLLNKKTAHSLDQVLNDINDAIKLDTGSVKKIFTIDGKPVVRLQDFFQDDSVFVAYGPERYTQDDFDLDRSEIKYVSAYGGSVRQKERITLRSPKPQRRLFTTSNRSHNGASGYSNSSSRTGSPTKLSQQSPKSPRRVLAQKPQPQAHGNGTTNGHAGAGPILTEAPPADLTERYKIGRLIGEGNFAVVKECLHRASKMSFALKVICKRRCHGKEQMIENEVSILRQVKHQNIIMLVEEYETPDELYLVMELVKGGDLFEAITTATKYTERDASGMLQNLASAIHYLHASNIVHRDIKPENLLVCLHDDGTKSLKLGDFGLACEVKEELFVVCGTPTYVAPEVLAETGYGVKVDVWALGVITYILLCGFPPFVSPTCDQEELFDKIMDGSYEFKSPFWDDISSSAKEFIGQMLQVDPANRLSAEEVLHHPWVAGDTAKDQDVRSAIASHLDENFTPRKAKFSESQPGISLIASTALDKASRFFQGRKQLHLQEFGNHNEDEVF